MGPIEDRQRSFERGKIRVSLISGGAFLMFVAVILYIRFTRDNARGEKSLSWPVAAGRITKSRIEVRTHRTTSTDYLDQIEYEYTVQGQMRRGGMVDLQIRDVSNRAAMQAFVDSYPVGKQVQVHYDPDDPDWALLIPGPSLETSGPRLLLAKILFPLGLGLIVVPFWRRT
jgi:hypothetical protein